MDRNTIIGLVLIGLILSVFTIFNQPTEEELAAQAELVEKEQEKLNPKVKQESAIKMASNLIQKLDEEGSPLKDSTGGVWYTDTLNNTDTLVLNSAPVKDLGIDTLNIAGEEVKGELIRLENEKIIIEFNTKGGQVSSVRLKEFESYDDFAKKDEKIDPLLLFDAGDATNGLKFPIGKDTLWTKDRLFTVKEKSNERIVFELPVESGSISFAYNLKPDAYDLDYDINVRGLNGKVSPQNVMLNWDVAYKRSERLLTEQRRVSTVCYKYTEEGFSYLSEMTDDNLDAEDDLDWVSFKQSYFSSFMNPEVPFSKNGSKLYSVSYGEDHPLIESNIKDYSSFLNLNLKNVENATARINWYFGPNDFKTLASYEGGYDDILNYGWGLFRWINLYAVQPMFNVLKSTGVGIGIAILLLTLLIKFALMPIQWKMYTSSAKMRILKPEIDELNAKYPEKDDAMKKQMEMMTLYRESGASPLSGCVPMLIPRPILLAVFRFFPSTFDLRQKGFLWAEDLSSYDSIYDFGFNVWMYGDHVSLFTLLMAVTTLIYTAINSGNMQQPQQPGMPNMKIIMYFFPIMMIFFFNNYSSGLSYYYFISTLTSIIIMILIKNFFVDEDKLKAKMAARKAASSSEPKKGKTKSKFQERLEQMQKAQQEQLKKRKK
jgi:YidC/Oxa1 family membrane protein insertase